MNISQTVLIIGVLVFIVLIIGGLMATFLNRQTTQSFWKKEAEVQLLEIAKLFRKNHTLALKQSIVEMDKLLDYALQQSFVEGSTLGDRLKSAKNKFNKVTYNNIWEGHKLRNRLVHEVGVNIPTKDLKMAYFGLKAGVEVLIK